MYAADPFRNEWDTVVDWFYHQQADVYLTLKRPGSDTLHLGSAQGLYCLLNVGDNNADGRDEIAFVTDYLDYSRVNSCKVYSLCGSKWTLLKEFSIHEDAFNFTTDTIPVFTQIEGFLEQQNGRWVYLDYMQDGYDNSEDAGNMQHLKTDKCR